jgi:hypothetical protein
MSMRRSWFALVTLILVVAACSSAPGPSPSPAPTGELQLTLLAGPVCPVETVPPDPNCEPRPVAGREILLLAVDGREVARGTSDAAGRLTFRPPPAAYVVRAAPFDGFPSPPADETVTVTLNETTNLTLAFDTGIR